MDKHKAKDWREVRRRRAWELKRLGWKQRDIAEALGVTEGAVSQWLKAARVEGVKGLAARKRSGRPPRLTAEQQRKIPELLVRGAEAHGFRGDLWTRARVAVVLRREFGVTHSPQHVGTLLQQCGWSRQQPLRRARQRDEVAINGPLAVRFLKHLLRWIDERLLVIWDGSPIHRSRVVKEWLRQTDGRVWLERLPGYAPDLNPDEAVWNHLKHVQLANVCSPDLSTHRQELLNAIRRFRRREDLIPAFFKAPGL